VTSDERAVGASDESAAGAGEKPRANAVSRSATAFGHFWWDFLIGDTPELFLATLAVIGLAVALRHDRTVAIVVVLAAVIGCLAASTWRGRKKIK
jgi:hypothetical protein